MIILTIRTDNPDAEIGLYNDDKLLSYEKWTAHRQLANTIHQKILDLLQRENRDWNNIKGIVMFAGPGSFTGLRIGITVGNALAQGLRIPIVGMIDQTWKEVGIAKLIEGQDDKKVMPIYGTEVHITPQKK